MSVPSLAFLGFVAAVAAVLALRPSAWWRRAVLFVANVAFFLTFAQGPFSLVPFVAFLAAGYVAMLAVARIRGRTALFVATALLVAAFCWLKRYAFVPGATYLTQAYVTVGLSYAFFRVVGLVVDAAQGVLPARVGPAGYLNYTLNFTSFVSGPIELYKPFHRDEVERPAPLDAALAGAAIRRIVLGFLKVTVLSPLLAAAQQRALEEASRALQPAAALLDASLLLAIFPVYLYVNFSGYTDVMIGAARFLRLELPENFDHPFRSRGYLEFWTRWHMSLSNWFKTYVYSPLLLAMMHRWPSREIEPLLGVVAYFVTFFLVGLWHGQTPMFLLLGVLMGAGVSGNKLFQLEMIRRLGRQAYQRLCDRPSYAAFSSGLTFLWLAITLVFFWASAQQLGDLARAFGFSTIAGAAVAVLFVAAALRWIVSALDPAVAALRASRAWAFAAYLRPAWYAALATVVVSVAVLLNAPAPHLVYKAF